MDFTISTYSKLISAFKENGYVFMTFSEYLTTSPTCRKKILIMRHDVDEQAHNALKMAKIEYSLGIKATYYFRIVKQSNNPDIIREIVGMGHEIGYHYEDLSIAEGDYNKALHSFDKHLNYFRSFYPVKTVCMHGSSSSKYDNRLLWNKFKLEDFGIIGEPYLTLDFNKIFYLTDTGYSWDGSKYAVRDVVDNRFDLSFHTSEQIIRSVKDGRFPDNTMILAHTLWTDKKSEWIYFHIREFIRNKVKLMAKNNKIVSFLYRKAVILYWKS